MIALTTHASKHKENQESLLKNKFLSIIRDEIRNPLNAILGFSECLKKEMLGSINVEQLEALQAINSSGNNLIDLLQIKFEQSLASIHSYTKQQLNYNVNHNDEGDYGIVQTGF
jgi:signal transduction histidine kinase